MAKKKTTKRKSTSGRAKVRAQTQEVRRYNKGRKGKRGSRKAISKLGKHMKSPRGFNPFFDF